ncbi:DUF4400 domain-containing protein [Vibrio chaetopteri]|uniref:DUF4400 domain-containing protein n=1 Tax=Vibrio chaetopteri TaxID=3016528 RepID=A0AAU8BSX0_9VIBR
MSAYDTNDLINEGNRAILGDGKASSSRIVIFVVVSFFLLLSYSTFLVPTDTLSGEIVTEVKNSQSALEPAQFRIVLARTERWYEASVVATGIQHYLDSQVSKGVREGEARGKGMMALFQNGAARVGQNIKLMIYRSLFRINYMAQWFIYGSVAFFIFLLDAYYTYKIRLSTFEVQNIKLSTVMLNSTTLYLIILWLYLFIPLWDLSFWNYLPLVFMAGGILSTTTLIRHYTRV